MRTEPYLVDPGTRKGNKYYIIRGTFDGKADNERSTRTADAELAGAMLARLIYEERAGLRARELKTFDFCADQYIAWKNPPKRELQFIDKLRGYLGDVPANDINQSHLVAAANSLYRDHKASSKNRAVMRPASAILHYAAKPSHKWCDYWQVELFEEEEVKKRSMKIEDVRKLVEATDSLQRLFLLWLFKHADRITASVMVEGKHINLAKNTYERLTGKKKKKWQNAALDGEVKAALIAQFGPRMPEGRIFPWGDRHNVYRWTKPLSKHLKVKFTPHMARHSILSWIGDAGGNSIQIKTRAGHASLKSSEPYLAENLDITREITAQFSLVSKKPIRLESRGTPRGNKTGKAKKHA